MESIDSEESYEETDGIITDIVLQIVLKITGLIRQILIHSVYIQY